MSNNLGATRITGLTSGKEAALDDMAERMDAFLTEAFDADVNSGNVALTNDQYRKAAILRIINAGTAGRTVTLPTIKRSIYIQHLSGAEPVDIVKGSTTISVDPGTIYFARTDGTANGLFVAAVTEALSNASSYTPVVAEDANVTLTRAGHARRYITGDNASDITYTVDKDSDSLWDAYTEMEGVQLGVGKIVFVGDTGVDIHPPAGTEANTNGRYSSWSLKRIDTNVWILAGDLELT